MTTLARTGFLLLLAGLVGYALVLLALQPAVVNGDGIGYLRQLPGPGLAPGHPAYLPLLRGLALLWPHATPLDLVLPFRLLSTISCLVALLLLHDAGRRLYRSDRAAMFGVALLGLSHAFIRAATEVEVYGVATLLAVATLWALTRHQLSRRRLPWAAAAGLFAAGAALLHLTLVLLALPLLLLARRRDGRRQPVQALVGGGAMLLALALPLALLLARLGLYTPAAAWGWLRSADHGIPDPHGWSAPLVALWGLARGLVHVPYPYESSMVVVVLLTMVAALAWLALVFWARRTGQLDWATLLVWATPMALFAVVFFPSDTDRWIFVLPAVALCLAPLGRSVASRWQLCLFGAMALVNLPLAGLPSALDRAPLRRARTAEQLVARGDLVVSPGHGWDELVGMGTTTPPVLFPLIYHVGAEGGLAPAVRLMHRRIGLTMRANGRVFVARLRDQGDSRGYKELAWYGLSRTGFARLFARYRVQRTRVSGLWRVHGYRKAHPAD